MRTLKAMRHLKGAYVFSDAAGSLWSRGEADTHLRRARQRAGLRKFGWHTLRHTFCSHLTMRYMHLTPSAAREAIALLERQFDGNSQAATERPR